MSFASVSAAQTMTIAPAVEVTFETVTNRVYQMETASAVTPEEWISVGPTRWGRSLPLSQSVVASRSTQLFFRTRELDLTNGLHNSFSLDGHALERDSGGSIVTKYFLPSRFGTANHAARSSGISVDGTEVSAHLVRFAPNDEFTISLWVMGQFNVPSTTDFGNIMGISGGGFSLMGTNGSAVVAFRTNVVIVSTPVTWQSDRWYCIQLVRAAGVYLLYRDFERIGQSGIVKFSLSSDYFDLFLGPKNGGVDEARFYDRALSLEELGGLYRLAEH